MSSFKKKNNIKKEPRNKSTQQTIQHSKIQSHPRLATHMYVPSLSPVLIPPASTNFSEAGFSCSKDQEETRENCTTQKQTRAAEKKRKSSLPCPFSLFCSVRCKSKFSRTRVSLSRTFKKKKKPQRQWCLGNKNSNPKKCKDKTGIERHLVQNTKRRRQENKKT